MNSKALREMVGKQVLLRPVPLREPEPGRLEYADDEWVIQANCHPPAVVRLSHPPTGFFFDLTTDNDARPAPHTSSFVS